MNSLVFATLALCACFVLPLLYRLWIWVRMRLRCGRALDQFPGPPTHWLQGNLDVHPGYNPAGLAYLMDMAKKYGWRAFRLWLGKVKVVLTVAHPETMREVMMHTEAKPTNWGGSYSGIVPYIGDGLVTSKGQKWFRNRRLLTPAFHFGILKSYVKVYNEAVDILMTKFMAEGEDGKRSINVAVPVNLHTLNVVLRCAFSYEEDVQRLGEKSQFVKGVRVLGGLIMKRITIFWHYWEKVYSYSKDGREFFRIVNHLHDIARAVIRSRKQDMANGTEVKKSPDFLDILLLAKDENGKGLTDVEIAEEVDTFLFAGHDTTGSAISFALYALANNPEHQRKCQEEIDSLLADRENQELMWEDLSQIPYLTMCIRESLRMYAPVPFIGREVTKEFELDGVKLPAGACIHLWIYLLHHNEEVWGANHWDFKPERFTQENIEKMDPFAYLPFSGGARNCIGQNFALNEIKVTLCRILHRFSLTVDKTRALKPSPKTILEGEGGIWMYFHPRKP